MTGSDKTLAVCICTDGALADQSRLARCLGSVLSQDPGAGMALRVILVDNSDTGAVLAMAQRSAPPVRYVHEPIRGIPYARNAGLLAALDAGADLIAFIDADELAPPGWLALLRSELEASQADVVQGNVRRFADEAALRTFAETPITPVARRRSTATGATNNTLMRAWIVSAAGLRFDTAMRFTGGSDGEFFMRAVDAGATIVRLTGATVGEFWPPERAGHFADRARSRRVGANCRYRYVKNRSLPVAALRITLRCAGRLFSALRKAAAAPVTGRGALAAAMIDLSFVQGCLMAARDVELDPYRPTTRTS